MKKVLPLLAIGTLLLWGGMFLYFYLSGRVEKYLDPAFRIYALISGIGFLLLGAFNFLNRDRAADACCGHDHHHGGSGDGHEHHHGCGHDHHHGHDHDHDCGHDHDHAHHHACEHDHDHACEHGHGHSHSHAHGGCCGHEEHVVAEPHHHHHDHDDSPSGVLVSLLILIVPLLVTTAYSKDRFSSEYLSKWGKIERQMMQMRIAKEREGVGNGAAPVTNPYTSEGIAAAQGTGADTPPDPSKPAATTAAAEPAWGTFTMEDLKKMVPQNDKGEFLLDVPQIFYTAGDKELMQVMEGIPVETTAQLMEETLHNPNKTRLKAFRLFIECCAADARPLSIPIDFGKAPPEYTEMGWYKIYGKLHYANENDEIIPLLQIERIEQTSEPTDGLLF